MGREADLTLVADLTDSAADWDRGPRRALRAWPRGPLGGFGCGANRWLADPFALSLILLAWPTDRRGRVARLDWRSGYSLRLV